MPEAMKLATEIASKSPLAMRYAKQSMNVTMHMPPRDGYRFEQGMTVALSQIGGCQGGARRLLRKAQAGVEGSLSVRWLLWSLVGGLTVVQAAAAADVAPPAGAASVTMAVRTDAESIDPHYHVYTPNSAVARHIFDGLTRDRRAGAGSAGACGVVDGCGRGGVGVQAAAGRTVPRRQAVHRRGCAVHLSTRAECAEQPVVVRAVHQDDRRGRGGGRHHDPHPHQGSGADPAGRSQSGCDRFQGGGGGERPPRTSTVGRRRSARVRIGSSSGCRAII